MRTYLLAISILVADRSGVILKREIGPGEWVTPVQSAFLRRLLDVGG